MRARPAPIRSWAGRSTEARSNAADYVTAEQLRKHLNRPDIVAKAIQLASAEEAVRTSYGTEFKLSDLLARPAPRLRILSPAADSTVNSGGQRRG